MFLYGAGLEQDESTAAEWASAAANSGLKDCIGIWEPEECLKPFGRTAFQTQPLLPGCTVPHGHDASSGPRQNNITFNRSVLIVLQQGISRGRTRR